MKKIFLTVVIVLFAATAYSADEGYLNSRPVKKLKRGAINVVTAPVEIPKKVKEHWDESSGAHPFKKVAYIFGGTVKGLVYTVGRMGSGLWDILTLNLDIPGNMEPLMKPDYVLGDANE